MIKWTFRPVGRAVHFLGRTLFRLPVPLWVCESHFEELPKDPNAVKLPCDDDPKTPGAYIRSLPVEADLPRFGKHGSLIRYVPFHYDRTLVSQKNNTYEEYLSKFASKERNTLKRKVRKYQEAAGDNYFKVFTKPEEVSTFLKLVDRVSPLTYQNKLYGNQLTDSPYWNERLTKTAQEGNFYGTVLMLGEEATTFWLFTRIGDVLLSEYTGFDPNHRALSPGVVLLYKVLEYIFETPELRALDFGEGDAFYKQQFGTDTQRCAEVFYLRPTLRNAELLMADNASWAVKQALVPIDRELDRRGWRAPLKRFIRGVK